MTYFSAALRKRRASIWYVTILSVVSVLLLVSCPHPITIGVVDQMQDLQVPVVNILSPADGSSFAATVVVSGHVTDTTDLGDSGGIGGLAYELAPALMQGGGIHVDDDGYFSFAFSAEQFDSSILVTVTAVDWNGNEGSDSVTLENNGPVPSFAAQPGATQAVLTWDPVPLSESYSVFYTTDGTTPTEDYGIRVDDVSSPWTVSGLQNGALCVFRLLSVSSGGADNWSDPVAGIPLSPNTLNVTATADFEAIEVEWDALEGANTYEVWRAPTPDGPYVTVSGQTEEPSFRDASVPLGEVRYYKVRPAAENGVFSAPAVGSPSPFPPDHCELRYSLLGSGYGEFQHAALVHDDLYVSTNSAEIRRYDLSNPAGPKLVDSVSGYSGHLAVHGDRLYASNDSDYGAAGLHAFDRHTLALLESRPTDMAAIATDGIVLVGRGEVIDADPDSPTYFQTLGTFGLGTLTTAVAVRDGYAYMVGTPTGRVDVDPYSPDFCTITSMSMGEDGIVLKDDYAITGGGFSVTDIDPASGTFGTVVHSLTIPDTGGRYVHGFGNYAYVSDWLHTVHIVDVEDPLTASIVDSISMFNYMTEIVTNERFLCIVDQFAVRIFDVAHLDSVSTVNTYPGISGELHFAAGSLVCGGSDVALLSITDPSSPFLESTIPWNPDVWGSSGAIVMDYRGVIYDILDPTNPGGRGVMPIGMNVADVRVDGDSAYFSHLYPGEDEPSGFSVGDISNPDAPRPLTFVNGYDGRYVDVNDERLCVTDGADTLYVFDISDPYDPVEIGDAYIVNEESRVRMDGEFAYILGWDRFGVVDIGSPSPGMTFTAVTGAGGYSNIALQHPYAFFTTVPNGDLVAMDISDPANPSLNSVFADLALEDVVVLGRYAYASGSGQISVIDLLPDYK